MTITPLPSHLSLSFPQFYHHLRTRSQVMPLYLSMPWSRVNAEYSIHRVPHTPSTSLSKIDCLPLPASLSYLGRPCCSQFATFTQLRVNQWIESQLPSRLPPELLPLDWPPPSTPPISLDHGLQVHLQTRPITASKFAPSWHPSASPNSLDDSLQLHLQTRSLAAFKCIFKLARLRPPGLHDHGLEVHLQTCTSTALECISKLTRSRCGEMVEPVGRQCIINTPLHLAWYPKGIHEKERF